jgi:hypothetical protein
MMAKGLRSLAQLPVCTRSSKSKQVEAWLQTYPIVTPLPHSLRLALSTTLLLMAREQVKSTEHPPKMSRVGLRLLGRRPRLTTR